MLPYHQHTWCVTKDSNLLKRGPQCDTVITKNGYGGVEDSCTFLEIKHIRNGIEALSTCSADSLDKPLYYENVRVQIIGKRLKIAILKEYNLKTTQIDTRDTHRSMCVEVQPTPDGYLNVRQGPGMNFKPIAKLVPGQRILVDMQTDEWTHLRRICDEKEDLDGWVYNKYVKDIGGSNIKTLPPSQTRTSEDNPPKNAPPPPQNTPTQKSNVFPAELIGGWCYAEADEAATKYNRWFCAGPSNISIRQGGYYGYLSDCEARKVEPVAPGGTTYRVESRCQQRASRTSMQYWTEITTFQIVGTQLSVRVFERK